MRRRELLFATFGAIDETIAQISIASQPKPVAQLLDTIKQSVSDLLVLFMFEPNDAQTRDDIRLALESYRQNAMQVGL